MDQPFELKPFAPQSGYELVMRTFGEIGGSNDRLLTAWHLVETLTKEELARYIADMLLGVEKCSREALKNCCPCGCGRKE